MEIHGSDIVFENVKVPITEDLIIPIIKKYWPNLVYETLLEKGILHIFVHPNRLAEESWNECGWSEENDTGLIYVIWDASKFELTFVIDDYNKNKYIIDEIQKVIGV